VTYPPPQLSRVAIKADGALVSTAIKAIIDLMNNGLCYDDSEDIDYMQFHSPSSEREQVLEACECLENAYLPEDECQQVLSRLLDGRSTSHFAISVIFKAAAGESVASYSLADFQAVTLSQTDRMPL
jgi:hypothetical protein